MYSALDSIKNRLEKCRTYQTDIPAGCASVLQLLDVLMDKLFKASVRVKQNEWMINGDKESAKAENLKRPDFKDVYQ